MKETFYFSHDYNARNDWKLVKVMMKHWVAGIGVYWCIVEMLYEEWWYIEKDYDLLSYELRCDLLLIKSIVEDYWLFKYSDESIYSESVIGRLAKRAEKSEKAKKNIMERWGKNENRKIADNTIFYVIEVSHEDESFIKCWITSESISRRYSWKLWPYTYSILHQEDVELEIALWREREVAKIANSYIPFEKFWWYLECYSIDDKEKILDFVLQREYKGNTIKERKGKEIKEKESKTEIVATQPNEYQESVLYLKGFSLETSTLPEYAMNHSQEWIKFCLYWSETWKTWKIRAETEKTFELKRRFATWISRKKESFQRNTIKSNSIW